MNDEVFAHFGYDHAKTPGVGSGCWPNDGKTIMRHLRALPEILEKYTDPKKKIRVVFDYDPDFPRALFQLWGLEDVDLESIKAACSTD